MSVQAWRVDRQEREKAHQRKVESDNAVIAALEKDLELTKEKLHNCTQGRAG
jgi:hypothetical protein